MSKREHDAEAGAGDGSEPKRARPSAAPPRGFEGASRRVDLLNPATPRSEGDLGAENGPPQAAEGGDEPAHPMAALDAIRARLVATGDPHLQAKLLLRYSEAAISPGALTDAAIDFLFAFLQENQRAGGGGGGDEGAKGGDAGSSGAIVVGAIVRGLRSLLAVKAAVVEPMIQVDAMGEQLMQCVSVGEDFKLRRDMMRIVVDCLMLSRRFAQVSQLLATCVRDHDAGMQLICLRGYLRLHDAGHGSAVTANGSQDANSVAAVTASEHFDRLATFLLHGDDEGVRVLSARAIAALATEAHTQRLQIRSAFFPSSVVVGDMERPLMLQEMGFYVLCMAGNDSAPSVRAESALLMRSFISSRSSVERTIIESAVLKMSADEAGPEDDERDDEMQTIRMMTSGALLSLLEDVDIHVAEEATRTLDRMARAGVKWSERALRRVIAALFDVLTRLDTFTSATQLRQILISSLSHISAFLSDLYAGSELELSAEQMSALLQRPSSVTANATNWMIATLTVIVNSSITSLDSARATIEFVISASGIINESMVGKKQQDILLPKELLAALSSVGKKCKPILLAHSSLSDQLASQSFGGETKHQLCRAVLVGLDFSDSTTKSVDKTTLAFARLVGVNPAPKATTAGKIEAAQQLAAAPLVDDSGVVTSYLKALQLLRFQETVEGVPACFAITETLMRLKDCIRGIPKAPEGGSTANPVTSLSPQVLLYCRQLIELSRSALVKQLYLSGVCRAEVLQLMLLGKLGIAVGSSYPTPTADHPSSNINLAHDASRTEQFLSHSSIPSWFRFDSLRDSVSAVEVSREFVRVALMAWPSAWLRLASTKVETPAFRDFIAEANASIFFDGGERQPPKDPIEITANWPFKHHVHAAVENVRDVSRLFIKSELPDGEKHFHHVPASALKLTQVPNRWIIDDWISLTIPPFSDPTTFSVTICIHDGQLSDSLGQVDRLAFIDISPRIAIPIFHRSTSALRPPPISTNIRA